MRATGGRRRTDSGLRWEPHPPGAATRCAGIGRRPGPRHLRICAAPAWPRSVRTSDAGRRLSAIRFNDEVRAALEARKAETSQVDEDTNSVVSGPSKDSDNSDSSLEDESAGPPRVRLQPQRDAPPPPGDAPPRPPAPTSPPAAAVSIAAVPVPAWPTVGTSGPAKTGGEAAVASATKVSTKRADEANFAST